MFGYIGNLLRNLFFLGSPPECDLFQVRYPFVALTTIICAGLSGMTWNTLPWHMKEFINQAPIVIVCMLWTLDMIVGTILAVMKKDYSPRKTLYGLVKLVVYASALIVAYVLHHDGIAYDDFIRPVRS